MSNEKAEAVSSGDIFVEGTYESKSGDENGSFYFVASAEGQQISVRK